MTQANDNALQTAAFTRRVFCRALTVLGGVVAGTALAWWLSSTAASAESKVPTFEEVTGAVHQVTSPVAQALHQAVDDVARQLPDAPPPPPNPFAELGQKVKDATDRFRADADNGLPKLPSCPTVCLGDEPHGYPLDSVGRSDLPGPPAPAPAATPVAPSVAHDVLDALAPKTAKDRAFADGMSRRGSPEPAPRPGVPNWPAPMPFTPGGLPTSGSHGSAGNAGDSDLLATLPSQDGHVHLVAGGIATTTDAATSSRVNAQPGVAPD